MPPHLGSDLGIDKAHDALQLILKLIAKPRPGLAHTLFPGTLCSTLLIHWRHPFENSFMPRPTTLVNRATANALLSMIRSWRPLVNGHCRAQCPAGNGLCLMPANFSEYNRRDASGVLYRGAPFPAGQDQRHSGAIDCRKNGRLNDFKKSAYARHLTFFCRDIRRRIRNALHQRTGSAAAISA